MMKSEKSKQERLTKVPETNDKRLEINCDNIKQSV